MGIKKKKIIIFFCKMGIKKKVNNKYSLAKWG
jgi:hypothetical protein